MTLLRCGRYYPFRWNIGSTQDPSEGISASKRAPIFAASPNCIERNGYPQSPRLPHWCRSTDRTPASCDLIVAITFFQVVTSTQCPGKRHCELHTSSSTALTICSTLSRRAKGCHLVTDEVVRNIQEGLNQTPIGICQLFIKHTSAALTVRSPTLIERELTTM